MVYTSIFLYIHSDSWKPNALSSLLTRITAAILHRDGDIVSHEPMSSWSYQLYSATFS